MAKSYEELVGSLGRAVYFRPERRRVRELLSRDAEPTLQIGGRRFRLFDVSLNGVSFTTTVTEGAEFPVGREVDVGVIIHGNPLFFGRARVARREDSPQGVRVGLGLLNGILDLPEFHRQDEENRLERELSGGPDNVRKLVPAEYREHVERAVTFIQYYRQSLGRHEARYKAQAAGAKEATDKLAHRAVAALRERWRDIDRDGSRLAATLLTEPAVLQAAKRYTETLLTPLLMDAPMVKRSYSKPLGYPGDYQIMIYYYENQLEGDSVFARVFHKYFVEHPLSNGVRTRKDYVIDLFAQEVERTALTRGDEPFRAASLGCGPARELADFVRTQGTWPGAIHWTLIDQEEEALSVAYQAGTRALATATARGTLECLHVSFSQLINDPSLFPTKQPQHLIYSVGLFDYLRESRAQELIAALYERLTEGGLLLIGNALGPNEHFWSAELVLDWTLLYRTQEEMRRLAAKLPPGAEVDVQVEPGNAYYFLVVRKH